MKIKASIQCVNCNKVHQVKLEKMHTGNSLKCSCGTIIEFEGDDMRKVQKASDNLDRILKNFGK